MVENIINIQKGKSVYLKNIIGKIYSAKVEIAGVIFLLIMSFALRLVGINSRDLWLDECTSIIQANQSPREIISTMAHGVHPPLFHLSLHYWMSFFGDSPFAVRSMSLFFGLILVLVVYFVCKSLFNERIGFTTAFLFSFSPFFIWYSQDARMYIILLIWATLAFYFGFKLFEKAKLVYWLLYVLFTTLMLFTSYFGVLMIVFQNIFFIIWFIRSIQNKANLEEDKKSHSTWKERLKTSGIWISSQVSILILFLPWVRFVLVSRHLVGIAEEHLLSGSNYNFNVILMVFTQSLFGFHSDDITANLVSLWPLLMLILFILVYFVRPPGLKYLYLIIGIVVPLLLMYIIGLYREMFIVRYIAIYTIPLYVFFGCIISSISDKNHYRLFMIILAICAIIFWADQSFSLNNRIRYDNQKAISYVQKNLEKDDAVIYVPYYIKNVFLYYYKGKVPAVAFPRVEPADNSIRSSMDELSFDLNKAYKNKKRVWMITSFEERSFVKRAAFRSRTILRYKYTNEVKKKFPNVDVYLFSE